MGKGIYTSVDGNRYEGDWNDDFLTKGICVYANGDKYEGNFMSCKPNGYGKMKYHYDNYYEGNWKDGKRDGKGIYKKVVNMKVNGNQVRKMVKVLIHGLMVKYMKEIGKMAIRMVKVFFIWLTVVNLMAFG